jgi:hypothetical protein
MTSIIQIETVSNLNPHGININGSDGLPNSLREAFLQRDMGDVSLLLDAIYLAGWRPGRRFTRHKLRIFLSRHYNIPHYVIQKALTSGLFAFKHIHTKAKGRPEKLYTLPYLMPLVNHYAKGLWTPSDKLYPADFDNVKAYRIAIHRALIERHPGTYSRQFLGRRIGVSKRTVRTYDNLAGIKAEMRTERRRIDHYSNWQDLVAGKQPGGAEWLEFVHTDGRIIKRPIKAGIIWKYIHEAAVYIVRQLTNYYELVTTILFEDDPAVLKLSGELPY